MGTVRIDEDLIGMGLSIDDAHRVMEKRREAKALQRKIDGMTESYEKRITPHVEAIETIRAQITEILPGDEPAFPWEATDEAEVVEADARTGEEAEEPQEPSGPNPRVTERLTKVQ